MQLIENTIEQNLAAYIEANADSTPTSFRVKRELDIARHALEESLALHGVTTKLIRTAINTLGNSESDLIKLIALANNLEERHNKLQQSAKNAASIAKTGAEVEMLLASKLDAAQVYSILAQLPALLLSLSQSILLSYFRENNLSIVNGKVLNVEEIVPDIANTVANAFNEELERSVNVLTYKKGDTDRLASAHSGNGSVAGGIIESQVVAMLNTVPLYSPQVVEPDSSTAKQIKQLTDVEIAKLLEDEVE